MGFDARNSHIVSQNFTNWVKGDLYQHSKQKMVMNLVWFLKPKVEESIVTIFLPPWYRALDNFQVQRASTPYFWKWWVFAYFLCTVVLSTSEKIAYMYTCKIMFDTSVIQ
jgi:hypothetical protein